MKQSFTLLTKSPLFQVKKNFANLLKQRMAEVIPVQVAEMQKLRDTHGEKPLGTYTVDQVLGGMRGMYTLFQDLSRVDPDSGVLIKGLSCSEMKQKLQTAVKGGEPLPESVFWLLSTGEAPSDSQFQNLSQEWKQRGQVPEDVFKFVLSLPKDLHSMTMLSMAIIYMQKDSLFKKASEQGQVNAKNMWEFYHEDSMNLVAKMPTIAAAIYRHKYHDGKLIKSDPTLDWAGNYSHMLGYEGDVMKECLRGYLSIHCDHEGGNVSAHTTHLVGSSESDAYSSFASGVNGLAGPLHGLANQEVLKWILELKKKHASIEDITDEDITAHVHACIKGGQVVPGFGHAVLRQTDPRFTHQVDFSKKYLATDPLIKLCHQCSEVIPHVLEGYKKIKNPFPNVDLHSGVLLYTLGLKEYEYYTTVFAVSRSLGCLAWLQWARAYGLKLERPNSIDMNWLHLRFSRFSK